MHTRFTLSFIVLKNRGWLFINVAIACLLLQAHVGEASSEHFVGSATSDNVYIRSGPNKNFEVLHKLEKGEEVVVLEKQYDWYNVLLPKGARCFIAKEFITIARKESFINATRVNLRSRPTTDSSVIGQVDIYDEVVIIDSQDDWYKIIPPRTSRGWVHANFIDKKQRAKELRLDNQKVTQTHEAPLPTPRLDTTEQETITPSLTEQPKEMSMVSQEKRTLELQKPIPQKMQEKPLSSQTLIDISTPLSSPPEKIESTQTPKKYTPEIAKTKPTIQAPTPETEIRAVKKVITPKTTSAVTQVTGFLEDAGKLWSKPGTHKLLDNNGKLVCYLKSGSIDLNTFVYYKVNLWGEKLTDKKHSVINVTKIESIPVTQ